ncbi:MAG: carbamoyltransferase HypF [Candidatus Marinimicrobia bacterium]|nr:carbamoyltransferase HypF [Candidatus Neomarinimicrobiota bacterium]
MSGTEKILTYQIHVSGTVQGVGFRPTVYNLAQNQNLFGFVLNDSEGVKIHLQSSHQNLEKFIDTLRQYKPPRSIIQSIDIKEYYSHIIFKDFQIKFSEATQSVATQISPDLDVCKDCLAELFDESNPRYLYPFINCTNCGPRFTITKTIPYDRHNTTMNKFSMCSSCQAEYNDPKNRRFHAQPNGCHCCGPELQLADCRGNTVISSGSARQAQRIFDELTEFLRAGKILAIKGIGGFHLACDAGNEQAVRALRQRKYREDKPFAVMFSGFEEIEKYCEVTKIDRLLLEDVKHPIVLLKKKQDIPVAAATAPGNQFLGCMLPYTPVHHILMHFFEKPLIMTSGNISDEPIKYSNETALKHLSGIADYFLLNNREINIRSDDSVVRSYKDQEYPIRRSRGYVPMDLNLGIGFKQPVLACGAEQKNVFALAKNDKIYMSHHIGDLKNLDMLQAFETGIHHFESIFEIDPKIVVVDKHPNYLSTQFGKKYAAGKTIVAVQHHHAHAASCMAENGLDEKVIALILDGTGYGNDGKIWGGECLVCDFQSVKRIGHFREAKIPGGDPAIKNIVAMGLSYLYEIFGRTLVDLQFPVVQNCPNLDIIIQMLEKNVNSPVTTSCGRLFDGVAALCGFRSVANYEGQAAVELEQQIENRASGFYDFFLWDNTEQMVIDWEPMIRQLIEDVQLKQNFAVISEKFHRGLTEILYQMVKLARKKTSLNKVVLSGGVFMNSFLLKSLENKLLNDKFSVYTHRKVPTNDGGIALGQLVIANNHQ